MNCSVQQWPTPRLPAFLQLTAFTRASLRHFSAFSSVRQGMSAVVRQVHECDILALRFGPLCGRQYRDACREDEDAIRGFYHW